MGQTGVAFPGRPRPVCDPGRPSGPTRTCDRAYRLLSHRRSSHFVIIGPHRGHRGGPETCAPRPCDQQGSSPASAPSRASVRAARGFVVLVRPERFGRVRTTCVCRILGTSDGCIPRALMPLPDARCASHPASNDHDRRRGAKRPTSSRGADSGARVHLVLSPALEARVHRRHRRPRRASSRSVRKGGAPVGVQLPYVPGTPEDSDRNRAAKVVPADAELMSYAFSDSNENTLAYVIPASSIQPFVQ